MKPLSTCPPLKLHQVAHVNVRVPVIEFGFPTRDRVGEDQIHIPVLPRGRLARSPCANRPLGLRCSEGRACDDGTMKTLFQ